MNSKNKNICLLTLPEIASWQIASPPAKANPAVIAGLPALQRGAVWKVRQIEDLWDSILQSFPIGAFLVSKHEEELGSQPFKFQQKVAQDPTHLLLDGQQRATGIALGFFDPWEQITEPKNIKSILWMDLGKPESGRDVDFVLRVVTRAHPWGYRRADPNVTLGTHPIRLGLRAFKLANHPIYKDARPSEIALTDVWPWDADAPVPLAILIGALVTTGLDEAAAKKLAWERIQALPFMKVDKNSVDKNANSDGTPPQEVKHWQSQQEKVRKAFTEDSSDEGLKLGTIFGLLKQRLSDFVVPIMTVPLSKLETSQDDKKSPVETLFIRINSSGTPLAGEELIYSLIKSSWIGAPAAIEERTHKLAPPARIALLASRLVRARHQEEHSQKASNGSNPQVRLIPTPNVNEFRRLMRGLNNEHTNFFEEFKCFIERDGLDVFDSAYEFLTCGKFALPPVLAAELAQQSPDVFFLFLRWLDKLQSKNIDPMRLSDATRRRAIGFLTAVAWFSSSDGKPKAIDAVWDDLQKCEPKDLQNFFEKGRLKKTYRLDNQGKLHMVPIIDPDDLEKALEMIVLGHVGCSNTITKADSTIWTEWNWWQWLIEKRPNCINSAFNPIFHDVEQDIAEEENASARVGEAWERFINSLWHNKSMLLYVQRDWIKTWFPDFDPSIPEFLEDKNRPWDYDHIHPQSCLKGKGDRYRQGMPQLIKDWHGSIGNLRAWPLEANRADGDNAPAIKLADPCSEEENLCHLKRGKDKRTASFIAEDNWTADWGFLPEAGENFTHEAQKALVNTIVRRFVAIYRAWYEMLKLSDLT